MSTPSNSASGNMRPASMTMMSSPQRTAMQFMPNSPRPPRGMICSFPVGMGTLDASTEYVSYRTDARFAGEKADGILRLAEVGLNQWGMMNQNRGSGNEPRKRWSTV